MQPAVEAGPTVPPERRAGIRIVVDAERLSVDGRPVGARSELGAGEKKLVKSLARASAERRGLWDDLHPGEPFDASSDSTVPPDLTWMEGANLVATLAFAHHPGPHTVHSGDKSFTFDFYVRPPPEAPQQPKRFVELCRSTEGWSVRSAEDRYVPIHELVFSPWRPLTNATLGKLLGEECAAGCSSFSIGAASAVHPWRDVLEMIAAVRRAKPDPALPLTFTDCERPPAEQTPARVVKQGKVLPGEISVKGALPAEVVSRIVRQNFGRFRFCYGDGLARDPRLKGSVTARMTIDSTGAVSNVANAGSKLPDAAMVKCVLGAFHGLTFPRPDHGSVTVIYPLTFGPAP